MTNQKAETKFDWDLSETIKELAKTTEYANPDPLKVYEHQYGVLDTQIKMLEKTKGALRAIILQKFENQFGHQGYTYSNEETGGSLQRIIQIRTDIDDDKVKKLLNDKQWNMIKKEIVDTKKFFEAINLGVIKAYTIQETVTEQEINKLLWKKGEEKLQ